jgi:D-arabinose 1-dehydrogenase-like Zn-dependent alcohol dehydrogenase
MKSFWDERYTEEELAYGDAPNVFFAEELNKIEKPGKLLLPMEGQGRNAVYAAKLGWDVIAFDFSEAAKESALELARKHEVTITYYVSSMEDFRPGTEEYDVVALIYAHLPENIRKESHQKLVNALKKNGTFIVEGFEKKQLNYNSGGPKNEAMLYSLDMISNDFDNIEMCTCEEKIVELKEGKYHVGEAAVVRFVGKKK